MNPGQLVPAVGAHGLQFCVFAQGVDGLIEPAQPDQHQAQAVPGPVKRRRQTCRFAKGGQGVFQIAGLFKHEAQVEPGAGLAGRDPCELALQRDRLRRATQLVLDLGATGQCVGVTGVDGLHGLEVAHRLLALAEGERELRQALEP